MKRVCMVPARLGSQRVKKKNLRFLGDRPLVAHVICTARDSGLFDEIYLNSEDEVFREIAEKYGASFYHRPSKFATDSSSNDDFVLDFLKNVDCESVVQVNPTSPFISAEDLENVCRLLDKGHKTVQSVKEERIEAIFDGHALNFDPRKTMPRSQDLKPVLLYSSGIMAFEKKAFLENMETLGSATYGGSINIGYHVMAGYSQLDIDYEDDFKKAEVIYSIMKGEKDTASRYWEANDKLDAPVSDVFDADRERILSEDGVFQNNMFDFNRERVSIQEIIKTNPKDRSWSHTLVNSPSNTSTLIAQMPGEGNRTHFHPDWNEWWYIVQGSWDWYVDDKRITVKEGDVVFIEQNRPHRIEATGSGLSIRMAVSRADVVHAYTKQDYQSRAARI